MVDGVGALFDNPILNTKININQKLHRLEYHHGHFLEKQTANSWKNSTEKSRSVSVTCG